MELRFILIFSGVFIVLQLLLWSFSRTLAWLFKLNKRSRFWLTLASFIGVNALFLLTLTRIFPFFRTVALLLALLWFAFLLSSACYLLFCLSGKNAKLNLGLRLAYPFMFAGLTAFSVYNAYTPKVKHYQIQLNKPLEQPLRIGLASDFHLGSLFGAKQLDELAAIFAREKVDLILLPGDIMDDNVEAYVAENMRPHLAKLTAPLGVFATLGNHDFFGSQQQIAAEIQQAGIQVLWDEAVKIDEKFVIVGRNDKTFRVRPTTEALLQNVDTRLPVFLLDHQPDEIDIHSKLPIDIQVSGHTHKGQIFPANLLTALIYPLHHGYKALGNGHFFTTSGYGFWGIPMRLGSQSEVMIIEVNGKK